MRANAECSTTVQRSAKMLTLIVTGAQSAFKFLPSVDILKLDYANFAQQQPQQI